MPRRRDSRMYEFYVKSPWNFLLCSFGLDCRWWANASFYNCTTRQCDQWYSEIERRDRPTTVKGWHSTTQCLISVQVWVCVLNSTANGITVILRLQRQQITEWAVMGIPLIGTSCGCWWWRFSNSYKCHTELYRGNLLNSRVQGSRRSIVTILSGWTSLW